MSGEIRITIPGQVFNMAERASPISPVQKLRALMKEPDKIILGPGVYDGLTARIALQAGFDCLYMVCKHRKQDKTGTHGAHSKTYRPVREPPCRGWACRIWESPRSMT